MNLRSLLLTAAVALFCASPQTVSAAPTAKSDTPLLPQQKGETVFPLGIFPTAQARSYNGALRCPLTPAEVKRARAAKSATAASRAANASLDLRGWVAWPQNMLGLYILPSTDTESFTPFGNNAYGVINGGGYDDGHGQYHGVYYQAGSGSVVDIKIFHFDSETFDITNVTQLDPGADLGIVAMDIDVDPTTGVVYGCYMTDDARGYCWGRADYNTGQRTKICDLDMDQALVAVGSDANGQFYGINREGYLVKINKATGAQESVALTGIPNTGYLAGYAAGGAVDRTSGLMYVTYITPDNVCGVYEVNLATGVSASTVTFRSPAMVVAPFFYAGNVQGKTPMSPTLTLSAPEGTMTVTYTITLPEILEDGTPISGLTNWEVYCEGQLVNSGANMAGAEVVGTTTLQTTGMAHFTATASNNAGKSLPAEASIFVGNGLPQAPANVKAEWADGVMTISWDAVTASSDGGYLNPEQVRYTVTRDGETVANAIEATTWNYSVSMPDDRTSYTYTVIASFAGSDSPAVSSNTVWLGAFSTPYAHDFTNLAYGELPDGFTIVDVNDDGKTWGGMGMSKGIRYYYSSSNAADDWLISPEIKLEAGKVYPFQAFVSSYSRTDDERIEVKAGQGLTPADMTVEVVGPTKVLDTDGFYIKGLVAPDQSGKWNIGLHAISDKNKYYLIVRDMAVGEGVAPETPDAVSDIQLTREPSGLLQLTGSFKLPTLDVTGQQLSGTVTVKVSRGDQEVATLSGAPGATIEFADTDIPEKGTYTYTVTTMLGEQKGVSASASAFVGPYAAAAPATVTAFESYQPGTVTLTWDRVATDINGDAIAASNVTYMVYSIETVSTFETIVTPLLDAPVAANNATVEALEDVTFQKFLQFAVTAFNRDAESEVALTDLIPVGKPYNMPLTYSGSDSRYIERISRQGTGFWDLYSDETLAEAPAPVATDDYYGCYAGAAELYGDLYTGKINLTEASRPEVQFYTWKFPTNHKYFVGEDVNFIEVIALVNNQMKLVGRAEHSTMTEGRWNKARFDLSDFNGKNIQLMFRAVTKSGYYTLLDEATVKETPANDLCAIWLDAPASVKASAEYDVKALVANEGYRDAGQFTVTLYRDGNVCDTREVPSLAAGEQIEVVFPQTISYFDEDPSGAVYSAEISFAADEDLTNNIFDEITVERPVSSLPAVSDLRGEILEEGNRLTWTPYTVSDLPAEETNEDFEGAIAWSDSFEGWTFLSESSSPAGQTFGVTFPGITAHETHVAWFVVNNLGAEDALPAHSGNQFICSLLKSDGQPNNDWAISPALSGKAQTVSFHALSYNNYYAESFEFYYTLEDSTDPADYLMLGEKVANVSAYDWTRYEYQLPEGAKHFAVRCTSADCYFLMLDDFTFTPDPLNGAPVLAGYDVFRDGKKLTTEPLTEAEYLDTQAGTSHRYHVVAHYDKGSSELSNEVLLERSALMSVMAENGLKISAGSSCIVVENPSGATVTVNTVDGRTIASVTSSAVIPVVPGIYLAGTADNTVKILVR